MRIGQVITPANYLLPKQLMVGEKLAIEVISKDQSGTGVISIAGKHIPAKIETSAAAGERIFVVVKEINSEGVTLARINPSAAEDPIQYVAQSRGLPNDPKLAKLLLDFAQGQLTFKTLLAKDASGVVPQWENISAQTMIGILGHLIRYLGLDYEQRIYRLLLKELSQAARLKEIDDLQNSIKGQLMQRTEGNSDIVHAHKLNEQVSELRTILAQQLWLNTGTDETAYFLLAVPLYDKQNLTEARIAITGPRKGAKVDSEHCRIGIEVEAQNLGTIGADIWLHTSQIHLMILCDKLAEQEIDQELLNEAKHRLASIGLRLESFLIKPYTNQKGFQEFVRGQQGKGVDLWG